MKQSYYILAALLVAPLASQAQQPSPPAYRYYGGLALYSSDYQYVSGNSFSDLSVPVQATLGYQLRPRLAVQASLAYSQYTSDWGRLSQTQITPDFTAIDNYFGQSVARSHSFSLLARYTLTRRAAHRLQVDMLGGATLEQHSFASAYQYTHTFTDKAGTTTSTSFNEQGYTYSLWLLTGGVSARYGLGRHLEAVLDATLNSRLARLESPPTLAGALGLRYRFGGLR
ncbi:hypothetical protein A0257_20495 [Hymenobacter psoromatis]|nr:hypothetical protein A0257_20495 [Hymenobacter psoromatis]